ncbi:MAG: hypothetical protein WBO68_14730 [Pyrinomonadaceae bacterium]
MNPYRAASGSIAVIGEVESIVVVVIIRGRRAGLDIWADFMRMR